MIISEGVDLEARGLSLSQYKCRVSVVFASCDSLPLDLSHVTSPFSWSSSCTHHQSCLNSLALAFSSFPRVSCESHQLDSSSFQNNALVVSYPRGGLSFYVMVVSFLPIPLRCARNHAFSSCLAESGRFHGDSSK